MVVDPAKCVGTPLVLPSLTGAPFEYSIGQANDLELTLAGAQLGDCQFTIQAEFTPGLDPLVCDKGTSTTPWTDNVGVSSTIGNVNNGISTFIDLNSL